VTRAQSMEVVNDSTTMQSRIDAVLAAPIMEWDHSPEIQWQPGDPLWQHPEERTREVIDFNSPVLEMPHGPYYSHPEYGGGNCPRYMLEIIGLSDFFTGNDEDGNAQYQTILEPDDTLDGASYIIDCDDCLVGLGDDEVNCWVCGRRVLMETKAERRRELAEAVNHQTHIYWHSWWNAMAGANDGQEMLVPLSRRTLVTPRRNGRNAMEGFRAQMSIVDELSYLEWPSVTEERFLEYTEADVALTRMWLNLNPNPVEPCTPPSPDAPIFWDSSQRRWAELKLQEITPASEPELPDIPRLTLQETNPDLYRPRYERYFESENNNAQHLSRPRSSGRRQHSHIPR